MACSIIFRDQINTKDVILINVGKDKNYVCWVNFRDMCNSVGIDEGPFVEYIEDTLQTYSDLDFGGNLTLKRMKKNKFDSAQLKEIFDLYLGV